MERRNRGNGRKQQSRRNRPWCLERDEELTTKIEGLRGSDSHLRTSHINGCWLGGRKLLQYFCPSLHTDIVSARINYTAAIIVVRICRKGERDWCTRHYQGKCAVRSLHMRIVSHGHVTFSQSAIWVYLFRFISKIFKEFFDSGFSASNDLSNISRRLWIDQRVFTFKRLLFQRVFVFNRLIAKKE